MEAQIYAALTWSLDGRERSALRPGCFAAGRGLRNPRQGHWIETTRK